MAKLTRRQEAILLINSLETSLKRKHKLLSAFAEPDELFEALTSDFDFVATEVGVDAAGNLKRMVGDGFLDAEAVRLARYDCSVVTCMDEDYPACLLEIFQYPLALYVRGDANILGGNTISVVGTRTPTRYGLNVAEEFCLEFAKAGLTVVSGLAKGIDAMAHKQAVLLNKPTIAVVANGLDIVYPSEHKQLAERIVETGGAIVSEYKFGTKPSGYQFPERNRIICGLSKGLFAPEAKEASGTMITINLAIEQGKTPYVTPSNINSIEGKGTNKLLKEMQGCLVTEPEDILADYGIKKHVEPKAAIQLSISEQLIANALSAGEKHFEELLLETGLNVNELSSLLIQMEIGDVIDKLNGNYYQLK